MKQPYVISIIILLVFIIWILVSRQYKEEGFDIQQSMNSNNGISMSDLSSLMQNIGNIDLGALGNQATANLGSSQNLAPPNAQPLESTDYTINTETSFVNFIQKTYKEIQSIDTTIPSKTKNVQSILKIANMYPALQSAINQDFNELNKIYPNVIQTQTDLNHLMGLYLSSNAIYQYMHNILPEGTDLTAPGNESKYNSQIGVYDSFYIHMMHFYEKKIPNKVENTVIDKEKNTDAIWLFE